MVREKSMINLPPIKDEQLLYRIARLKDNDKDFQHFLEWLEENGHELRKIASEPVELAKLGEKNAYSGAVQYNDQLIEQIRNAREIYEQIKQNKKIREGTN